MTYVVECMQKDVDLEFYFGWLVDELRTKQESCERTIIYCQTIKQCDILYATIKGMIGKDNFRGAASSDVLVEMLHSCTPASNKASILHSFQSETGTIRVLIATIAFGMGVDCKGVHRVIHYGPSRNVEAYMQETGRAGRDEIQSVAHLLYHGILLNHVDGHMKSCVKTKDCRRKELLQHFDSTHLMHFEQKHLCCDNCASKCECGQPNCVRYATYPSYQKDIRAPIQQRKRHVLPNQRKAWKPPSPGTTKHLL